MHKGKAIIFSAPSGSGKTTIVNNLLQKLPQLSFSISAASRQPRKGEKDGISYHFLSVKEFKQKISQDDFVEWEEVYEGNFYGTLKSEINRIWEAGNHVIFDVDVKGGVSLKKYFGDDALAIFVKVPDIKTLETRLNKRGSETPESLKGRIEKAEYEFTFESEFDHSIMNVDLEKSLSESIEIVRKFISPA
ncbi:MAG: guanylate kinase [Reichenbachiella sp.]